MTAPEKPQTEQDLKVSDHLARVHEPFEGAQDLVDYAAEKKAKAAIQSDKFTYAVSYAKEQIILIRGDESCSTDNFSIGVLERMGMIGFSGQSELQTNFLVSMVAEENDNKQTRAMLRLAIARTLKENIELPSIAKEWLQKYLRDEFPALTPVRGQPPNQRYQHRISQIVQDIVEYIDIKPTRNDATHSKTSAIDAVANAMCELKKTPNSYDRIKAIWLKHRDLRISAEDLIKDFPYLKPRI